VDTTRLLRMTVIKGHVGMRSGHVDNRLEVQLDEDEDRQMCHCVTTTGKADVKF